jgi:hypothetical protein
VEARDQQRHRVLNDVLLAALLIQAVVLLLVRGNIAFALILVLVAAKFRSDRAWLVVPIIAEGVFLLTVLAQTVTNKPGEGPALLRPFLTYGVFLACYVIGYLRLGPPDDDGPSRGNNGLGWRFDRWAGR